MADLTRDAASDPSLARGADARLRPDGARLGMDYTPPPRQAAFRAADRHTAQVKFLRRAIILGSVFLVSIIAIAVAFNPLRRLQGAMSLAGVGMQGTKITMDSPKISGVQQGGGAYEIKAKGGIQDILSPGVIELVGVDAKVGMSDHTTTHILADKGTFNNKADTMALDGDVRIANTSGYVLNMKSALMRFQEGVFSSHERVRVDLRGGSVAADEMRISNNGHVIAFHGAITSSFDAPSDEPGAVPEIGGVAAATPEAPAP